MKMRLLTVPVLLASFAYSVSSFAEVRTGMYVKYLQGTQGTQGSNRAFVQFSTSADLAASPYTWQTGCQVNHSAILDTQTLDGKQIYALLMTAFITRQPLQVNVNGCGQYFSNLIEVAFGKYM
jgi:hypothetical protein